MTVYEKGKILTKNEKMKESFDVEKSYNNLIILKFGFTD